MSNSAVVDHRRDRPLSAAGRRTLYTSRFPLMGGAGVLRFVETRGRGKATRIARAAESEALRIEWKFSRYRDGSVVSQINRSAGHMPVAVDEETEYLVGTALDLARATGGRFDPTAGVLRRAWDFGSGRVPERREIDALLRLVDDRAVSTHDGTVHLRREGMELGLGGIAKAYAVDRVADLLAAEGVSSALVNFAGDVRTVGGGGERAWSIGVVDPRAPHRRRLALRVGGGAGIATCGDYRRFFVRDGLRYHHLLDARTGWPARGVASATAIAGNALVAGCLATAAFLSGPIAGVGWLQRRPGSEGVLIDEEGVLHATPGIGRYADLPAHAHAD